MAPQAPNGQVMRDRAALEEAVARGERFKFLYFWGHTPRADGRLSGSCLSQWWPAEFELDGQVYPTAEHFMMAEKARLFGDEELCGRIVQSPHPREAKSLGRQVADFNEEVWCEHRFAIVVQGNLAKFGQNDDLRTYLLGTGDRMLVEASPEDRVWGIGLHRDDPRAGDPERWLGENLLGFALMEVRDRLGQP